MTLDAFSIAGFSAIMALAATRSCCRRASRLVSLARRQFPGRSLVETLAMLPMVMPPVATASCCSGCSAAGPIGRALDGIGLDVVFTWRAVVVAMAVMSLPIIVLTTKAGFEHLNPRFEQLASTLGAARFGSFSRSACLSRHEA